MTKASAKTICTATQSKRRAWVEQTQLPPHLYGERRGTQRHQNHLRAQRMGRGKHRAAW